MPHSPTRVVLTLSLAALLTGPAAVSAAETGMSDQAETTNQTTFKTHEYTLKNGLKLIVREDHRAPVVVSQVWYKVGSSYEHDGLTGISHVLEHMMFKGTPKHPAGEFSRIIAANGGEENAFTGRDYTAYFQSLEKSRLPVSFELEADRMQHLSLQEDEFKKELQVVEEEWRLRTEDNPQALTSERFDAAAFLTGPYHHPVIGWKGDLDNLRVSDVREWYKRFYAPNNATVVVVGDVDPEQVLKLAKKYYGAVPRRSTPDVKPTADVRQLGERNITVTVPAELPYLIMGYKVPVLRTIDRKWEPYALDVLAGILDAGESARLPRNLIRGSQVAADADAGYDEYQRYDSLFELDGTPANGHTVAELRQALEAQVKQLQDKPVDPQELDRVKAQVVASDVYQRDSVFYQAMQIGMLETVGLDWRLLDEYVDRIRAVTPQQVQDVARKYLQPGRLTVAVLQPEPGKLPTMPATGAAPNESLH